MSCATIEELAAALSPYVVSKHDFIVGKNIGSGGFSQVYVGLRKSTRQICAIKVLNYRNLKKDRFLLYKREIEVLAKCQNPFIMGFVGFTVDRPYAICTEFLRNGSLYHALRKKSLSGTQKTLIALGIAHGMQRLHELKIIHRDLKSLNILLDKHMVPKIADFGLSRFSDGEETYMTSKVGTYQWMAPELFEAGQYDEKVDVYSYAVILWELLTGRQPFRGKNVVEIATLVLHQAKRPEIPAKTPSKLAELISLCWSADPKNRPSFAMIVKHFASHKVRFPGADLKDVDKMMKKVMSGSTKETIGVEEELVLPEDLRADIPNDIFGLHKTEKPKGQVKLPTPGTPNFRGEFEAGAAHVNMENAGRFFTAVRHYFQANISSEELSVVLNGVLALFGKDLQYLMIFVEKGVHEDIPLTGVSVNEVANVLLYLFTYHSGILSKEMLAKVLSLIPSIPVQILRFINIYAQTRPVLPHLNIVEKSMLDNAQFFVEAGFGASMAQLLYTICLTDKTFRKQHSERISAIFEQCLLAGNHECTTYVLKVVAEPKWEIKSLGGALAKLLMQVDTYKLAISVCAKRSNSLPCDTELIKALLSNGQKSKTATYVLMDTCSNDEFAIELAKITGLWLHVNLPSTKMTAKLLMRVLGCVKARPIIAQSPNLFTLLRSMLSDEKGYTAVATIIMRLPVGTEFVTLCSQTGFLKSYYRCIFTRQESKGISECLKVTNVLAKISFITEYTMIFSHLKSLLSAPGWHKVVLPLLYTLSRYTEAMPELVNQKFDALVGAYGDDPAFSAYVDGFLSNTANKTPQ